MPRYQVNAIIGGKPVRHNFDSDLTGRDAMNAARRSIETDYKGSPIRNFSLTGPDGKEVAADAPQATPDPQPVTPQAPSTAPSLPTARVPR